MRRSWEKRKTKAYVFIGRVHGTLAEMSKAVGMGFISILGKVVSTASVCGIQ